MTAPHDEGEHGPLAAGQAVGGGEDRDHGFEPGMLHDDRDLIGVQVRGSADADPAHWCRHVQARGPAGGPEAGRDRRRVKRQLRVVSPEGFGGQDVQPLLSGGGRCDGCAVRAQGDDAGCGTGPDDCPACAGRRLTVRQ